MSEKLGLQFPWLIAMQIWWLSMPQFPFSDLPSLLLLCYNDWWPYTDCALFLLLYRPGSSQTPTITTIRRRQVSIMCRKWNKYVIRTSISQARNKKKRKWISKLYFRYNFGNLFISKVNLPDRPFALALLCSPMLALASVCLFSLSSPSHLSCPCFRLSALSRFNLFFSHAPNERLILATVCLACLLSSRGRENKNRLKFISLPRTHTHTHVALGVPVYVCVCVYLCSPAF